MQDFQLYYHFCGQNNIAMNKPQPQQAIIKQNSPPRSPSPLTARFTILFHTAWPQCAEENMLPMASDAWVPPCCHSGYSTVSVLMGGDAWR